MSGIVTSLAVNTIRTKTRASYVYEIAWVVWNAEEKHIYDIQEKRFCPFVFVLEDRAVTVEICRDNPPFLTEGVKAVNRIVLASDLLIVYPSRRDFVSAVKSEYARVGKRWKPPRQVIKMFSSSELIVSPPEELATEARNLKKNPEKIEEIISFLEARDEEKGKLKEKFSKLSELEILALLVLRDATFSIPKNLLSSTTVRTPLLEPLSPEGKEKLEEFRQKYVKYPEVIVPFIPLGEKDDGTGEDFREENFPEKWKERTRFGRPPKETYTTEEERGEEEEEKGEEREEERESEEIKAEDGGEENPEEEEQTTEEEEEKEEGETEEKEEREESEEGKGGATDLVETPLALFLEELLLSFFVFSVGRASGAIPFASELILKKMDCTTPTLSAFLDIIRPARASILFLSLPEGGSLLLKLFRLLAFSSSEVKVPQEEIEKLKGELGDLTENLNPQTDKVYEKYLKLFKEERENYKYAIITVKLAKAYARGKLIRLGELANFLFPQDYPEKELKRSDIHRLSLMVREALKNDTTKLLKDREGKTSPRKLLLDRVLRQVFPIEALDRERKVFVPERYSKTLFLTALSLSEKSEVSRTLNGDTNHFRAFLKLLHKTSEEPLSEAVELVLSELGYRFRDRLIIPSLFI